MYNVYIVQALGISIVTKFRMILCIKIMNNNENNQVPSEVKVLLLSQIGPQQIHITLNSVLKYKNLIKLDLSHNLITTLPNFENLLQLRILYLHSNQISQKKTLDSILKCKLNYLSLFLNPICSQMVSLRRQIIHLIPTLWALDFKTVSDQERYHELRVIASKESNIQWPIVSSQEQSVYVELNIIRRIYEKGSIIILIQKFIRRYLQKKKFKKLIEEMKKKELLAKKVVEQWKRYTKNNKDLSIILGGYMKDQLDRVRSLVKKYRERKGQSLKQIMSARVIFKLLKRYRNTTLGMLKSIEYGSSYRLYFHKDQLDLFKQLLSQINNPNIEQIVNQQQIKYEDFQKPFTIYQSEVSTYRLPEFRYYKDMLIQPSRLAKVSYCMMSLQLGVIRKWRMISKFQNPIHPYPYIQKYEEQIQKRNLIYHMNKDEKQRFRKTYQMINKFQMREYRQLLVITIDRDLCKEFIKQFIYYNNNQPNVHLIVYFEKQMREAAAALKIQRMFRAYKDIKQNGMTITQIITLLKNTKYIKILQAWFRRIKYNHRNNFFKSIAYDINYIKQSTLYIPIVQYLQLEECGKQLQFQEQYGIIHIGQGTCIILKDQRNVIPIWIRKSIQQNIESFTQFTQSDIYSLLIYQSKVEMIQQQFLSFKFESVQEAKNRALLLALKSYNFRTQSYVKLYQSEDLYKLQNQFRTITSLEKEQLNKQLRQSQIPSRECQRIIQSKPQTKQEARLPCGQLMMNPVNQSSDEFIERIKVKEIQQECKQICQIHYKTTSKERWNTEKTLEHGFLTGGGYLGLWNDNHQFKLQEKSNSNTLKRLMKESTNPSRQCYRTTRSISQKTQVRQESKLPFGQQIIKSASLHQQRDDELERIKKFRQTQQKLMQQENINRIQIFNKRQQKQKAEKEFESAFVNGFSYIGRQNEKHQFKLQIKSNAAIMKRQVQTQMEQRQTAKTIYSYPRQVVKEKEKEDFSYVYPQSSETPRQQKIQIKYVHSILPEELYPLKQV